MKENNRFIWLFRVGIVMMLFGILQVSSAVAGKHDLNVQHGWPDDDFWSGTIVNITASAPGSGEVFDKWTGANVSLFGDINDPTTTFVMPNYNITITATYKSATVTTTTTTTTTITGAGASTTTTTIPPQTGGQQRRYSLVSVGMVRGQGRVVTVSGMRQKSWAQFALWSDDNRQIYFKSGEVFNGLVHSNSELWFDGNPQFYAKVTSAQSTYGGSTNSCLFQAGFQLDAPVSTMATVTFSNMLTKSHLVVTGLTQIAFATTNMLISNAARGWTNYPYLLSSDTVLSVATDSGSSTSRYGDVYIAGQLDGRVTVVAERDINVTNNLTYVDDPKTNASSNDALGLIANRDIVVKPSFPNNGKIYAHMMATGNLTTPTTDGSFGVENYDTRAPSGSLNMHGGIVQSYRGAVGTFSGTSQVSGFDKSYTYDTRFASDPPPEYPPLLDSLVFDKWKDQ